MTAEVFFIGVDVGTGSARAGIFNSSGKLLGSAKRVIATWHEAGDIVEQSSDQIWQSVCTSVREAIALSGVAASQVTGIGFDATCSLVAVKADGTPVTVSPSGDASRNIIVWMDHRSAGEAKEINAGNHDVLRYVGGRISPEMETPKLLWLKHHLPESFAAADYFFDLPDYLTWRASASLSRSMCTVTCKWTYLAHENRWDAGYFERIGLGEFVKEGFARIGTDIVAPGSALGTGLTEQAAEDLGLPVGIAVGASLIDAHAGGVGTLGANIAGVEKSVESRLAYIFGTSACSMASTKQPVFVDGVWGPYYSAMVPGLWLNEGGQSAAGAAIDHLVQMHPASSSAKLEAEKNSLSLVAWLEQQVSSKFSDLSTAISDAKSVHVVPEFLGNRSPFADPDARAIIAGIGLENDLESLIALYIAGLSGIGYGLKQLLKKLAENGVLIDLIVASGGAAQSNLVCQMLADTTNTSVSIADTPEPVLLGSAMLAAVAADQFKTLEEAMQQMSGTSQLFNPCVGEAEVLHDRRFQAFETLQSAARLVKATTSV
jgi:D-ribulokinase